MMSSKLQCIAACVIAGLLLSACFQPTGIEGLLSTPSPPASQTATATASPSPPPSEPPSYTRAKPTATPVEPPAAAAATETPSPTATPTQPPSQTPSPAPTQTQTPLPPPVITILTPAASPRSRAEQVETPAPTSSPTLMPTLTPFPADPPRLANGCPVPVEALSLPPTRPTNDLRGIPEHIDYFLYSGGTLPKLEAGLRDWGLLIDGLPPVSGLFYSAEQPAVAVAAHLQDGASSQYNVWVFDCLGRVRYQAFPVAPDPDRRPTRIGFVEVDGQPPAELLFTLRSCTARGCHTTWHAIRWVGPNPGDAVDLLRTVPPLADDIAEATLADLTGDGVLELRYIEPARAAPDAPPQRDAIRTWSLAGDAYIQARVERSAPVYRHQQVRAADELLAAGDIQGAIDSYQQALLNPALRDWPEGAPSPGAIPVNAFARYRLVQALLAGGQTEAAQQAYTELIFLYPPDTAGGPIAAFARSFWEHYRALPPGVPEESRGARLHAACLSAVESEASEGARDMAHRFGLIENDAELCPF